MAQNVALDTGDPALEVFFDSVQEMMSGLAVNLAFRIKAGDPTTVELPAGPGSAQASVSIDGEYRWIAALISRTHPGGAAGTYDLHLTSRANVTGTGAPPLDDFSFALAITAAGAVPAGVERHLRVRTLQWDGAAITRIDRLDLEPPARHAGTHAARGSDPVTPGAIGAAVAGAAPTAHAASHDPGAADAFRMTQWTMAGTYAARPAASAVLNGARYFATDKAMEWECVGGAWTLLYAYAPLAFTLPGSPIDGQECKYVAAANGEEWHLRYNGGTARWDFMGGSDLVAEILTEQSTTSNVFTDLATVGPSITLPLAGDYDITPAAHIRATNLNNAASEMSYAIGATAAAVADFVRFVQPSSGNLAEADQSRTRRKTGLAAGAAIVAKYRGDSAAIQYFSNRTLRVRPVRVF